MARLSNGFLGNASGKIGNVVFAKWRDIFTARQYQPDIQDAKTPGQLKQRERMMALLQFLKPLNKTFIKLFNDELDKGSTPWAVAIKENMKSVTPEACMPIEKFKIGKPKFPAMQVVGCQYDPFVNQTRFYYRSGATVPVPDSFPLVLASVLGKYQSEGGVHAFDTRYMLGNQPLGHFFSAFAEPDFNDGFDNFWYAGLMWLLIYEPDKYNATLKPNDMLSHPAFFEPELTVPDFNTLVEDNPLPPWALSWEYSEMPGDDILIFKVSLDKTTLTNPEDVSVGLLLLSLCDNNYEYLEPVLWNLSETQIPIVITDKLANGSFVLLYACIDAVGNQISRFNRMYINKNIADETLPYFEQLFYTGYTHPVSFILNGNNCGFCGSFPELFSDFVQFYERLYHKDDPPPEPPVYVTLSLDLVGDGDVIVENCVWIDEDYYYFLENDNAIFYVEPDDECEFIEWTGADAADVQLDPLGLYILPMTVNRSVTANFTTAPPEM